MNQHDETRPCPGCAGRGVLAVNGPFAARGVIESCDCGECLGTGRRPWSVTREEWDRVLANLARVTAQREHLRGALLQEQGHKESASNWEKYNARALRRECEQLREEVDMWRELEEQRRKRRRTAQLKKRKPARQRRRA